MSSLNSDPYGFYQQSAPFHHYPGFGVGEAGTWSNGDHMTFLGGYGGQLAGAEQQYGIDASIFGAGGGFGAFTQPTGYGFDFHTGSAGYSQWGSAAAPNYRPEQFQPDQDGRSRLAAAEQAMQGLNMAAAQPPSAVESKDTKQGHEPAAAKEPSNNQRGGAAESSTSAANSAATNGGGSGGPPSQSSSGSGGPPKKMSWATVASQPAKPTPPAGKSKKPGVLCPPVLPGAGLKPNLDIGTWEGSAQQNGGPPPPLMSVPPPSGPPKQGGGGGVARGGWAGGVAGPRGGGGRGGAPVGNGFNPAAAAAVAGPPPPSHPVLDELKSNNTYNPREFDLNPKNARFFVVKSYSEDDIHRSIKYEIWCSTEHGNKRLDSAFRERENKGTVYLFFSVNGSGHFCGMAEMLSGVDYNSSAGVWAQDKWKGQFKVRWIYVKDVPNAQLRHIRLENNENKPVTNSRDTQEVPADKGRLVLKILHGFKHITSIFDDFVHYEKRQEEDEGKRQPPSHQQNGHRGDRRERDDRDRRDDHHHRRDDRGGRGDHRDGGRGHHDGGRGGKKQ